MYKYQHKGKVIITKMKNDISKQTKICHRYETCKCNVYNLMIYIKIIVWTWLLIDFKKILENSV